MRGKMTVISVKQDSDKMRGLGVRASDERREPVNHQQNAGQLMQGN